MLLSHLFPLLSLLPLLLAAPAPEEEFNPFAPPPNPFYARSDVAPPLVDRSAAPAPEDDFNPFTPIPNPFYDRAVDTSAVNGRSALSPLELRAAAKAGVVKVAVAAGPGGLTKPAARDGGAVEKRGFKAEKRNKLEMRPRSEGRQLVRVVKRGATQCVQVTTATTTTAAGASTTSISVPSTAGTSSNTSISGATSSKWNAGSIGATTLVAFPVTGLVGTVSSSAVSLLSSSASIQASMSSASMSSSSAGGSSSSASASVAIASSSALGAMSSSTSSTSASSSLATSSRSSATASSSRSSSAASSPSNTLANSSTTPSSSTQPSSSTSFASSISSSSKPSSASSSSKKKTASSSSSSKTATSSSTASTATSSFTSSSQAVASSSTLASSSTTSAAAASTATLVADDPSGSDGPFSGWGTWFDVGLGACGWTDTAADPIVAVSAELFDEWPGNTGNPNTNPICNRHISITHNGTSTLARVADRCPGCALRSLDMSKGLFEHFASLDVGLFADGYTGNITWSWVAGTGALPQLTLS